MIECRRILVIAAHPDDEVLGCGATVARLASEGKEVFSVILGEGLAARCEKGQSPEPGKLKELSAASRRAGVILGARETRMFDFADNRFDTVPLLDIVKVVESCISEFRPQAIFTHHAADLNIDHCVTNRAVITATRPLEGQTVKEMYAFFVPSSTEWAFGQPGPGFSPNMFVDISGTLDKKVEAMACYGSETRTFPHPRSPEAIRAIAASWGSVAGVLAAEPFELIRGVR